MKKRTIIICLILLLLIILGVILYSTNKKSAKQITLPIATIWSAMPGQDGELDFDNAEKNAQLGRRGFVRGLQDGKGNLNVIDNQISEMTGIYDLIVQIGDRYREDEILMTIGANTDETSMYTSMAMNFFRIPMLIPFSDGDLTVGGSTSDYSMRMMPSIQDYSEFFNFLFSDLVFDYIREQYQNGPSPEITARAAVFFSDNFNGHGMAVGISQTLMDHGYDINAYLPYTNLSSIQNVWNKNTEELKNVDFVILIGEDSGSMELLSAVWHLWADRNLYPIFIVCGYVPDEMREDLADADNIYLVQPLLDYSECPSDIVYYNEALGYAAGQITAKALQYAANNQPDEPSGVRLWFLTAESKLAKHQDYIDSFRENIQNALMNLDEDIPCYGRVSFKNHNETNITLELVHYDGDDSFEPADPSVITNKILEKYSINTQQ